ncbi:ABC transporter ATP-binding protein/permease [Argonema galeatum]|uniref:ABC transporter ATP-binding protein/permease n=1 Tax=Argonema galeatum TaxID=2942762 RepID=UPI002012DC03|nr:ABC transporter ATP-binding protein/permease [Argonema galeatum]MCL1467475.1 ABC transporter ATP-binding protein/permease [Argonema galeatum A003/A1]
MNRLNLKPLKQFWAIAKLYWLGDEKIGAFGLLLLIGLLLLGYTALSVILNEQQGNLISALSKQDSQRFWQAVLVFLEVLVVYVPLYAGYGYLVNKLGIFWRRWTTSYFLDKYLKNRGFYYLSSNKEIDNPDQRISEDIKGFTQNALGFFISLIQGGLQLIAFSGVLWNIYKPLVLLIVAYILLGTVIVIVIFGKPLVRLRFEQLKKEANFRFSLLRIRENSESIAFYRGEVQESSYANKLFNEVFENFNRLILREFNLGLLTHLYQFLPVLLPAIILAPKILAGDMEIGKVSESIGAFMSVFNALNFIVYRFESLTGFVAGIDRLYTFNQYLEQQNKAKNRITVHIPTIDTVEDSRLAIKQLTLQTPNYLRTLVNNLSLELQSGQGLLVMGVSGCGKSSLLRAIAGLWNSGTGTIVRPNLSEMLFLPQRPYMILGTLRNQLIYPSNESQLNDDQLRRVLEQVGLPNLVERFGSLDVEQDWSDVLSLGEQQRVAFARLFITRPRYAILDEATSALDIKNEENLYQHLMKTGTTYISVGHRPTLVKYHHLLLELLENGRWKLSG